MKNRLPRLGHHRVCGEIQKPLGAADALISLPSQMFFFRTQVIHKLVPEGNSRTLNGVFFPQLPVCLASLFHLYYSSGGNIPNRINKLKCK